MVFIERYFQVLLVSSSEKLNSAMPTLFLGSEFEIADRVSSVSSAKRLLSERKYDLVVVNFPTFEDEVMDFVNDLSEEGKVLCLVLLKGDETSLYADRLKENGIYVISKPMSITKFSDMLTYLATTIYHKKKISMKTISLEDKMKEIRIINKAKWFLIDKENYTEQEAHRYIEKQAMDTGKTKTTIANEILKKYE